MAWGRIVLSVDGIKDADRQDNLSGEKGAVSQKSVPRRQLGTGRPILIASEELCPLVLVEVAADGATRLTDQLIQVQVPHRQGDVALREGLASQLTGNQPVAAAADGQRMQPASLEAVIAGQLG